MEGILESYEKSGRKDSGYVVMDVRNENEVASTGKLSPGVITLPLPVVADAFGKTNEDFGATYGFDKPQPEETLVFSCLSGKRAGMAAETVRGKGYSKIVVYKGGAKEWFGL